MTMNSRTLVCSGFEGKTLVSAASRSPKVSSQRGFTLMELMIAVSILVVVLVSWISVVLQSFNLVQETDNRILAINEASTVLNSIRAVNVPGPNPFPTNVTLAFPAGPLIPQPTVLPGELVTIAYPNGAVDPLFVTVTVQFTQKSGRASTESLSTVLIDIY